MSTHLPGFQSFLLGLLHHFVTAKLAPSSVRVNGVVSDFLIGLLSHWGRANTTRLWQRNHSIYKEPDAPVQCLSQDLETGCLNLAVVKFLGVQIFKGVHNILIFQP